MTVYKIGILHSLSGVMAGSEKPLVDAALLAIDEINSTGGILGNRIEPVIEDGASDPAIFIEKANKLIQKDKITTIFGCWTSFARKAIKPAIEKSNSLLWYPVQYEGLESSKNIIYTGSCLNQQVYPAVRWLIKNQKKRFFLLGSDYVFPRTTNKFIKAQLKQENCQVLAEEYKHLGTNDFTDIISQIKEVQPDVIFNTLNGDSNFYFYKQYHKAGISYKEIPIMAVSIAEGELQEMKEAVLGHYACWSYFQSLEIPENKHFISNFKKKYGSNKVTSDPIATAYTQLYLWKGTVETANSFNISELCQNVVGQTFNSPGGEIRIEPNNHVMKNAHIGRISNGQFEIIWSSKNKIKPQPWFGLEELDFQHSKLVIGLLSEVSEGIQSSWILEQKTRELTEERQHLEQTVNQRTNELRETLKKMEDTNIRLKQANQSKTHFLSSMSHELRTPLNGILGFTDLLRGQFFGNLNQKQLDYVNQIDDSGKHLLSLINDLLDVAKIDAGAMDLEIVEIQPEEFFEASVAIMISQFKMKRINVKLTVDPALTVIRADTRRCRQIMVNLLSNALKYTPEGGQVEIRAAREGDSHVRVEVSDSGIGIDEDDIEKIFSEFQQANHVRDEELGGTGIGLALTRKLVELHGGQIGVESEPGQGSTFWFTLPEKKISDKVAAKPEETDEAGGKPSTGHRILVAEDNKVNLKMILDMLSIHNHKVVVAKNGQEAIELAQSFKPELIFMDIRMPLMNGMEATKRLRAMPEFADTPIIALTASTGAEAEERQITAGCTAHLAKPIQTKVLFKTLEKYLKVKSKV